MSRWIACVLVVAAGLNVAAADEPIEQIQAELVKANRKLKSFAAEYESKQSLPGKGLRVATDLRGTLEWRRDGTRAMFHIEQTGMSAQQLGDHKTTNTMKMLEVCDGDFIYSMNTVGGQTMAMKVRAGAELAADPSSVLHAMRRFGEVSVLPDEDYDGAACVVLETTAAKPQDGMIRQRYWFRKDIGLQVRMAGFDVDGQEVMSTMIHKIRINPALSSDRFKFVAPPGVQVMDMTDSPATSQP